MLDLSLWFISPAEDPLDDTNSPHPSCSRDTSSQLISWY